MFTGIVEELGTVHVIRRGAASAVLDIRAHTILPGLKIGDSVAVNGVCLTVTDFSREGFEADVMHETLDRSALAGLRPGSHVNLERAMPADGRFGGHIVSGHVDGTGEIVRVQADGNAVWYTIRTAPEVMRYIVEKGSIAVDGVSLTVAKVEPDRFSISAIPHTVQVTALKERRTGDAVNLENDIIGKYVDRLLHQESAAPKKNKLTWEFLSQNGF